jgi:hypothetical protein
MEMMFQCWSMSELIVERRADQILDARQYIALRVAAQSGSCL